MQETGISSGQEWLLDVPRCLPVCVRKRSGALAPFEPEKLTLVLEKCGSAAGEFGGEEARRLGEVVLRRLAADHQPRVVAAAELQRLLEEVLAAAGHMGAVRSVIACGERRRALRQRGLALVN